MSTTDAGHFTCPACGRPYDRRPGIVGRKMFCSCGQSFAVPPAPKAAVVAPVGYRMPPTPREEELQELMYGVDMMRDRIVPALLMTGGYLLYIAAYAHHYPLNLFAFSAVSAVFGIVVAAYTLVLLGLAVLAAGMFEVSFGRLSFALLKFAACAALCIGIDAYFPLRTGGSITPRRYFAFRFSSVATFTLVVSVFLIGYFFQLKLSDAGGFAALVGFFFLLFRIVLVMNISGLTVRAGGVPITLVGPPPPRWMLAAPPRATAPGPTAADNNATGNDPGRDFTAATNLYSGRKLSDARASVAAPIRQE